MSGYRNNRGNAKGKQGRRKKNQDEIPFPKVGRYKRKRGCRTSPDNEKLLQLLKPSEADVMKMLAAQTHIGRRRCHTNMKRYVWKRRQDGVHVINLEKTWAKMVLAARILVTVKDPADVAVMSTRTFGQRGAIKFAHYTGATAMVGKWVPGTFTNPRNKRAFSEPRVLIVDDPNTCFAALRETSYVGIPVIALMGTDNNSRFVDCGIPCNNKGKFSIGLMFWLLTRELLRMRGKHDHECIRGIPWKESVDLFFYRDADEIKKQQDAKQRKAERAARAAQAAAYGQQLEAQQVQGDYVDEYQDDGQQQDQYQEDMPVDDGQYMDNRGYDMPPQEQPDWDMPQDQELDDWGQQQDYGAPPQQMDPNQQPYDPNQQVYADPNQGYMDQDNAAMGMQNW